MVIRAALAGLLLATPASAACHHYTYWGYRFPQQPCAVVAQQQIHVYQSPGVIATIPVVLPPPTEEEQRAAAIDRLRPLLDALVNSEQRE